MKILIVGLGSIGRKHVDAIYELYPHARIFALRTKKNSETYRDVLNIYGLAELPFVPDFVIIANISALHEETILQMVSLNCPLFIEKPVLIDLKNSLQITNLIKKNNIITYVACNMRFHPCIEFLKSYVNSNKKIINEVNIYCGSYLPNWRSNKDFRRNYSANKAMGGGVHLDLIHELDYTLWIFGFPVSKIFVPSSKSSLNINSIDNARYLLDYDKFNIGITLNYYRIDPKRSIEILYNDDTIYIDLLTSSVKSLISGDILYESQEKMSDIYKKQIKYFTTYLKNKETPMNDFETAVEVLKIALWNLV